MLTAGRLRERVNYNHETGVFTWRSLRWGCLLDRVGCIYVQKGRPAKPHYLLIGIDGEQYLAHRLAWLYVHGVWPEPEVDHINRNGLDNRISNLRIATRAQNSTNAGAQKSNKLGFRGVHYHPGAKRYRAQITKHGKMTSLGYFDTPEEAYGAYLLAAKELHKEFAYNPDA